MNNAGVTAQPKKHLSHSVIHGFAWSYLSAAIDAVLHIVVLSVLAHLLSPREFGLLGVALIFISFAERVGQIGIGPALVQRENLAAGHIATGMTLSVLCGAAITMLLFLTAPLIASFFSEPVLISIIRALSLIFLLEGIGMVSYSLLQRDLRFKEITLIENGSYAIGSGVIGIGLAYLGYGVWALVVAFIASRLAKMALFLWRAPVRVSVRLNRGEAKDLLHLGVGFSLGRLLNFGALQGDNFIVGRMLGTTALGMYTRSYQLMTLPATYFAQIMDRVLFPAMAKKQSDRATLERVYLTGLELVSLLSFSASVGMLICAEEIILFLFGPRWIEVVPVLQILSTGVFFRTAYKCSDTVVRALGAAYRHAGTQAVYTFLVVGGSVIGTPWGLEGVAVAVCFAVLANYFLLSRTAIMLLNLTIGQFVRAHLPGIWVACIEALVLIYLKAFLLQQGIERAGLRLTICLVAAAIVFPLSLVIAPNLCKLHSLTWFLGKFQAKLPKISRIACLISAR